MGVAAAESLVPDGETKPGVSAAISLSVPTLGRHAGQTVVQFQLLRVKKRRSEMPFFEKRLAVTNTAHHTSARGNPPSPKVDQSRQP